MFFQVLYSLDDLRKYPYFDNVIDEISLEEILDPLTGVLNRSYSIKFVRSLITTKTPFTFTIIDLDNFKSINDTFGHAAGDKTLAQVTRGLVEYTKKFGLAGRFGGDELLFIDLKNITREEKINFFNNLYGNSKALRTDVSFDNGSAFITGTSGAASFPYDADEYSDLFGLIDKMLYLGKHRGRNCYRFYEEAVHKNIEIRKIAKDGIYTNMHKLKKDLEKEKGFEKKLEKAMPSLTEILQMQDLHYVGPDGIMKAVLNKNFSEDASDICELMKDDMFAESTLDLVKKYSPKFDKALIKNGFESVLVCRIQKDEKVKGYLVWAVRRSLRIWQENECALIFYLAELLADEDF